MQPLAVRSAPTIRMGSSLHVGRGTPPLRTMHVAGRRGEWLRAGQDLNDRELCSRRANSRGNLVRKTKFLEALNFEIGVPCNVQLRMLWHSAPTSLNNDLLNDSVILERYNKAIDVG